MKLSYRSYGDGPGVVLLHGLLGSKDNWHTFADSLDGFTSVVPDLRNHGDSPHADLIDYPTMAGDVIELIDAEFGRHAQVGYIGHSMGGKVAMEVALSSPERVAVLVVEDMVPSETPPRYLKYVNALRSIDLSAVQTRRDADEQLAEDVEDRTLRLFLLKNLERTDAGSYRWRANLDAIADQYEHIWKALGGGRTFGGPTLFVRGGKSDTVSGEREASIDEYFPDAELITVQDAGHWVHATASDDFSEAVVPFLERHLNTSS